MPRREALRYPAEVAARDHGVPLSDNRVGRFYVFSPRPLPHTGACTSSFQKLGSYGAAVKIAAERTLSRVSQYLVAKEMDCNGF